MDEDIFLLCLLVFCLLACAELCDSTKYRAFLFPPASRFRDKLSNLTLLLFGSPSLVLGFLFYFETHLLSHFSSFTSCPHVVPACVITCPALMCCTCVSVSPLPVEYLVFVFAPLCQFVFVPLELCSSLFLTFS